MQYIVKDTPIFIKGKLLQVGSTVSLSASEFKALEDYLIPVKIKENKSVNSVNPIDTKLTNPSANKSIKNKKINKGD